MCVNVVERLSDDQKYERENKHERFAKVYIAYIYHTILSKKYISYQFVFRILSYPIMQNYTQKKIYTKL